MAEKIKSLKKQKELIARALKVSKYRVKLNTSSPDNQKAVKELISRDQARELLESKVVKVVPKKGNSKTRTNYIREQKKKGRRQGQGSRKGTANARHKRKDKWMTKIRALRSLILKLKDEGHINVEVKRDLYKKAKGNLFRNKNHMLLFMEQKNLFVGDRKKRVKKVEKSETVDEKKEKNKTNDKSKKMEVKKK